MPLRNYTLTLTPDPLAGFKGPTSKGRGREGTGAGKRRAGKGREGRVGAWGTEERAGGEEGEVKGREGELVPPPHDLFARRPCWSTVSSCKR